MGRIKIKHPRPQDLATRTRLLEVFTNTVGVTRLIPLRDGIVILTATDGDADAVFSDGILQQLRDRGYEPLLPPELKAQRTVLCFRLDELLTGFSADEMHQELERQHDWAKIAEVYKFSRSNTIKVTFKASEMAKKALNAGLLMFGLTIPPHQMQQETYTPLIACNRCNEVESHTTPNCTKDHAFKQCSECAAMGHTFRDCTATEKRCLNCGGPHSARAMRCPVRKEAIKKKQEEERSRTVTPATTYAQASKMSFSEPLDMRGFLCLLHAHLVNANQPGSFQTVFSESLRMNKLPDVQLPPNPPSQGIMMSLVTTAINTQSTLAASRPPPPAQEESESETETATRQSNSDDDAPGPAPRHTTQQATSPRTAPTTRRNPRKHRPRKH